MNIKVAKALGIDVRPGGYVGHFGKLLPHFSTDNAAAIDALKHHGKPWAIWDDAVDGDDWRYHVRIGGSPDHSCCEFAPTLAHAACLALLRAVGAA